MTDNTNLQAKVALRTYFLDKIPRPANVLECYAGEERKLYNSCYTNENVTALDIKSSKGAIKIDNRKFIASQDITAYNFFDLDAYGSPYELLLNIIYKKSISADANPFVVICTDGLARNLGYGEGANIVQTVINNKSGIKIPFLNHHQEFIIKLILKTFTEKYHITCLDCKIVREYGNLMYYFGGLFQKTPEKSL